MATYKNYYDELYKSGKGSLDSGLSALDKKAEKDKESINATADKSIADIKDVYKAETYNANEAAEIAHRRNEMQRILNERHLERKAAEIGLTDSGKNLTQLTANQLSYGNQSAEINNNRQKTVDTLAAAMASKVADVNISRNASINAVDTQLGVDKANLESTYVSDISKQAQELYEKDVENASKYTYIYDDGGNVVAQYDKQQMENDYSKLFGMAISNEYSEEALKSAIIGYAEKYTMTVSEAQRLLDAAGITDFEVVEKDGVLAFSDEESVSTTKAPTVEGFGTNAGNNFTITVNGTSYAVENQGKVKNTTTKDKIKKAPAYGSVRFYDNKLYYESNGEFYEIGPREGFLNLHYGGTRDFDRLKDALLYN